MGNALVAPLSGPFTPALRHSESPATTGMQQRYRNVLKKYGTLSHLWDFGVAQGPLAYAATHTAAEFVAAYPLWPLWQDTAGTVPACKINDSIGLCLDQPTGVVVLGPELFSGIYASNISVNANGTVANGGSSSTATCTTAGVFGLKPNGLATTSGKTYVITFSWSGNVNNRTVGVDMGISIAAGTAASGSITCKPNSGIGGAVNFYLLGGQVGESLTISNISVREVIGAHAGQATTTKRPILSGRVNLLTATEDFSNAAWVKGTGVTATSGEIKESGTTEAHQVYETFPTAGGITTYSVSAKQGVGTRYLTMYPQATSVGWAIFDLVNGIVTAHGGAGYVSSRISLESDGYYRCSVSFTATAGAIFAVLYLSNSSSTPSPSYAGNATSSILVKKADLRPANSPTNIPPYQRVTSATDYDTVGFPVRALFDGVDDCLVVPSLDLSMTDKVTVVAGITKLSDAAQMVICELGGAQTHTGALSVNSSGDSTVNSYFIQVGSASGANGKTVATGYSSPVGSVVSLTASTVSDTIPMPRINGVIPAQTQRTVMGVGPAAFLSSSLNIGARNGGAYFPFNGAIQSLVVIGNLLPDGEVQILEAAANAAMGKVY